MQVFLACDNFSKKDEIRKDFTLTDELADYTLVTACTESMKDRIVPCLVDWLSKKLCGCLDRGSARL